ncbi:type IV secretion system protein [Brucella endophytica]|uniref:type IV secretion system protein n=1 Tax=Brucella endophytica TaxID=1963359 RepID=UPI00166A9665|nr:type IV secretion system protein [Brucella endophytica]
MGDFITEIMNKVDTVGSTYVQSAYSSLSAPVIASLKIFFAISVAYYGIRVMLGMSNVSLGEVFKRLSVIMLIMVGLSAWANYQVFIYDIVIDVPESVGNTLFKGFAAGNVSTGAESALQTAWDTGWEAVRAAFAKGGIRSMGAFLVAGLLALANIIFVVSGFFVVAMAKMIAFVLLALGPIFIGLVAFEWSRNWFFSWIGALFTTMCTLMIGYAILGLVLGIGWNTIESVKVAADDLSIMLRDAAEYLFLCVLGAFVFLQVPTLASMVSGGISANVGQSMGVSSLNSARSALGKIGSANRNRIWGTHARQQRMADQRMANAISAGIDGARRRGSAITSAIQNNRN